MKVWRKVLSGWAIATILSLCLTTVVLAVPGNVTNLSANPSDTSMILTWTPAPSSNSTVIRYRTDTYPTDPTTNSTLAYNGTGIQCTVSGLTAGAIYYFSAWGYDGAYSTTPANWAMNTLPITLPSGGEETPIPVIPSPIIPSSSNATANITGFNLEPFSSIIRYFITNNATSPGGLGMPENNAWESMAIGVIVMGGIGTYTRMKNFFIAYFVVFILTCFFIGLQLVQWYLAPVEIVVGLGVWGIERYLQ